MQIFVLLCLQNAICVFAAHIWVYISILTEVMDSRNVRLVAFVFYEDTAPNIVDHCLVMQTTWECWTFGFSVVGRGLQSTMEAGT